MQLKPLPGGAQDGVACGGTRGVAACPGWPGRGPGGCCGKTRCRPHPVAPAERAPWGRSFHSCSQPLVLCRSLLCSFCPHSHTLLLRTRQGWGDAKTCVGQLGLDLELRVGRGVSHSFTLCLLFCSSSLLLDSLPFPSLQCFFLFGWFVFFLSAFLCRWSWQE